MKNSRRGSAMLETALVMTVFISTLIAVYDFGQFLFLHESLQERARNALRYGTVNTYDATAIQNMVLFNQATDPGTSPDFNLTRAMVGVSRLDAGTPEDRIVLTLSNYPVQFFTPLIASVVQGKSITVSLPYEAGR